VAGEEEPTPPPAGETGEGQAEGLQKKQLIAALMAKKPGLLTSEDFKSVNVQLPALANARIPTFFYDSNNRDPTAVADANEDDEVTLIPPDRH
jgi:hypothetical protein